MIITREITWLKSQKPKDLRVCRQSIYRWLCWRNFNPPLSCIMSNASPLRYSSSLLCQSCLMWSTTPQNRLARSRFSLLTCGMLIIIYVLKTTLSFWWQPIRNDRYGFKSLQTLLHPLCNGPQQRHQQVSKIHSQSVYSWLRVGLRVQISWHALNSNFWCFLRCNSKRMAQ